MKELHIQSNRLQIHIHTYPNWFVSLCFTQTNPGKRPGWQTGSGSCIQGAGLYQVWQSTEDGLAVLKLSYPVPSMSKWVNAYIF